ncbi:hypothetical protein DBR32_05560 [Taibaiella sp. KBW10]|uniref:hypothetical protein n=1 Tax=Taibaiella sp. KBW10 TaxID=2153357 RepID=UPI000F596C44|nr:hypothetical protein [Taibaiella sp. KBW10]RQO31428.1 hypothetical protein DBR32_05560 [Taibaiella sp. KBW10]
MRFFFLLLFLYCLSPSRELKAQELLQQKVLANAVNMTTDELGNIYITFSDNSLVKYNSNGDSLGNFRSIQNGPLQIVDASNPLKLLLFYPDYSKVVFLDRMMSFKNELDLKKLKLYQTTAIGMARDGNIWVFDANTIRLLKIDDNLSLLQQSDDLRSALGDVLQATQIIDKDRKIYVLDSLKGLYVFDQFASILNNINLFHVKHIQVFNNTLIYNTADSLVSYDFNSLQEKKIPLPQTTGFICARIEKERLFYLYKDKLEIYRLNN